MNVVIITGASSGIGREFVLQMDRSFGRIDEFWLIARRRDKMEETAKALRHRTRIFPLDITGKLDTLEEALIRHKAVVRMLINCAGYGIMGSFSEQDADRELGMIRLNCEALTAVTHCVLPFMRRNSRIIQIASAAAFLPRPDFAVYAATKAYVLSFSRALGEELREAGIYVTCVCPGPVDTPFFQLAEATGSTLSMKKYMVTPERVVELALRDSYHRRAMSLCGLPVRALLLLSRAVPHQVILDIMTQMGKKCQNVKRKDTKNAVEANVFHRKCKRDQELPENAEKI